MMQTKKLEYIKKAGKVVGKILGELKKKIKIGGNGKTLEKLAKEIMEKNGVFSSSLNYRNFPGYICVSVSNDTESELTHGIPTDIPFKKGDLVSVDVACFCKDENGVSYHADAALTEIVEDNEKKKEKLINVTKGCLYYVISQIRPDFTSVRDIGDMIQSYVESRGLHIVKEYGGHCIGNELHEPPFIPNHRKIKEKDKIVPGMFVCIEPLVQYGDDKIKKKLVNNWEVIVSANGFLNAHFEHTVYITETEAIVLTKYE